MIKKGKGARILNIITLILCSVFVCITSFSTAIFTDEETVEGAGTIAQVHVQLAQSTAISTIPDSTYLTISGWTRGTLFNKTVAINTKASTCAVYAKVTIYPVWEDDLDPFYWNGTELVPTVSYNFADTKWHRLTANSLDVVYYYCTSSASDNYQSIAPNASISADVLTGFLTGVTVDANLPADYDSKSFELIIEAEVWQA